MQVHTVVTMNTAFKDMWPYLLVFSCQTDAFIYFHKQRAQQL